MKVPHLIDGPLLLDLYHAKVGKINKIVFLFGDRHNRPKYGCGTDPNMGCSNVNDCQTIVEFTEQVFKNSPTCVDFFFETPFIWKELLEKPLLSKKEKELREKGSHTKPAGVIFEDIDQKYADCFKPSKMGCLPFGNVRMHYADLRFASAGDDIGRSLRVFSEQNYVLPHLRDTLERVLPIEEAFIQHGFTEEFKKRVPECYSTLREFQHKLKSKQTRTNIRESLLYATNQSQKKPLLYDQIVPKAKKRLEIQRSRIKKQWMALEPSMRKELEPTVAKLVKSYIGLVEFTLESVIKRPAIDLIGKISNVFLLLSNTAIVMDLYLLFRMLKPNLSDSHIVIIYVGAAHVVNYSIFLRKTGFAHLIWKSPESKDEKKCIKFPSKVIDKINALVRSFPKNRCSYPRKTELRALAEHFGRKESDIEACLKESSRRLLISENTVLQVVWESILLKIF